MSESIKKIPVWILIVSGLFALMELSAGFAICFYPESMLENVDLAARGVDYLMYLWASRQIALGCIFAVAVIKRSAPMLTISYTFFLVMFIGDILTGIAKKENSLIFSALVMTVISGIMIIILNRKKRQTSGEG